MPGQARNEGDMPIWLRFTLLLPRQTDTLPLKEASPAD